MRTTIDAAGRIVVPKAIREAMGLSAGREIDVAFTDGTIQIELAPVEVRLVEGDGPPRLVPVDESMPELSDEMIRDTMEATRR